MEPRLRQMGSAACRIGVRESMRLLVSRALRHLEIVEDHDTGMWLDIYAGKAVNDENSRFWIHG